MPKKPTPISHGRIKKSAQVHMDDYQIDNTELLGTLKDRERKRQSFLTSRDAYLAQNRSAGGTKVSIKLAS